MSTNVADWLQGLGLQQYAAAFAENDIDGDVLPELTADDLSGLGVASIGHRRRLLAAIAALREDARQAAAPPRIHAKHLPKPARSEAPLLCGRFRSRHRAKSSPSTRCLSRSLALSRFLPVSTPLQVF